MQQIKLPHDHSDLPQEHVEQLLQQMPCEEAFGEVSELMKQLCDRSRVRIFWLLCHCEECVINLASLVGMSSPAVSHHLRQLKSSGLIVSRREGKEVYYRAAQTNQAKLLHQMIEKLVEISCPGQ
mgnify:FL=1